jgi:ankyrin repeat protein
LGWHEVVDAFIRKWNSVHGGLKDSLNELEDEEGGAGALHTAVAAGHADCVGVLLLHGFTRYVAQCCVVSAAKGDEVCLLRLLLFTKSVGGGGGLDVLLRVDGTSKFKLRYSQHFRDEQIDAVDITLLLPLLAAFCVWHNMVDPLVAICIAALEAGLTISGFLCIQDECNLVLSPSAAEPLWPLLAESTLLRNYVTTSPLHIAAAHGATAAAMVLLSIIEPSFDINSIDSEGQTALMWCMRSRCVPIAKLLLIAGADPNIGDDAVAWHLAGRNAGSDFLLRVVPNAHKLSIADPIFFRGSLDAAFEKHWSSNFRQRSKTSALPSTS